MPFSHPVTVRFSQVDPAGIAYFSRVFELCHEAFEAALAAAGWPLAGFFREKTWGLPLVHAEADFRRPLRLGDALNVEVSLAEVGERSLRFAFAIRDGKGEVRAEVQHVHAAIDLRTGAKAALPEDFVAAMRGACAP